MTRTSSAQTTSGRWRAVRSWLGGWWQLVHLGALLRTTLPMAAELAASRARGF